VHKQGTKTKKITACSYDYVIGTPKIIQSDGEHEKIEVVSVMNEL